MVNQKIRKILVLNYSSIRDLLRFILHHRRDSLAWSMNHKDYIAFQRKKR